MVAVNLWSSLARLTDGARVVEVEAATAGEALDALLRAHPALAPILSAGVTLVVDGEMTTDRTTPLAPGSEVYLMQPMRGG